MGEDSGIEWTHHTFNPWLGCVKVSPACTNCYAEKNRAVAAAEARVGKTLWGPDAERVRTSENYWRQPHRWNREALAAGERRRVFCASLADVFEDRRSLDRHRSDLWELIEETPGLDWLLLTKRPDRVLALVPDSWRGAFPGNVWIGTTVEDQARADERIPHLLAIPARVRFLSCEPLLGPVSVKTLTGCTRPTGEDTCFPAGISWVIVGGESGHGARAMRPAWARSLRDECLAAGVPFFFKQWGEWAPVVGPAALLATDLIHLKADGTVAGYARHVGKKAAGRELDGRTWDELPWASS